MLTPKQVSETLTVAPSTLRRWSKRFSKHLTPHEPHTHREYSTSDLETLRKIRDLLDDGLNYDDIEPKLDIIEPQEDDKALMNLADFNQVIEQARASIQRLQSQIDDQAQKIEKLENYLSLPLYKRIFTKPPKED
jgi:DNA-binding transcriptional MerR regulator